MIFQKWYAIFLDRIPLLIPSVKKEDGCEIRVGDVVLFVFQDSNIPGMETWKLARVRSIISPRTVLLEYVNAGGGRRTIERSIRQLSLILGVEELGLGPKLAYSVETLRTRIKKSTTRAGVEECVHRSFVDASLIN